MASSQWTADRRLYLVADGSRVVEAGHPEAARLWAPAGRRVPMAEAIRLGAVKQPAGKQPPAKKTTPAKQARGGQDKQRRAGQDKTSGTAPGATSREW